MAWDGSGVLNCRALLPVSFSQISHTLPMNWDPQKRLLLTTLYSTRSAALLSSRGEKRAGDLRSPGAKVLILGLPSLGA